jgi:meiotically up-regulated gene 157 (Mug157) protein
MLARFFGWSPTNATSNKMISMQGLMHESFDADNPNRYTRDWFGWANSLFAELIIEKLDMIDGL